MEQVYELLLKLRKTQSAFGLTKGQILQLLSKYRFEHNTLDTRESIKQDLLKLIGRTCIVIDDTSSEEIGQGLVSFIIDDGHKIKRLTIN